MCVRPSLAKMTNFVSINHPGCVCVGSDVALMTPDLARKCLEQLARDNAAGRADAVQTLLVHGLRTDPCCWLSRRRASPR